MFLQIVSAKVTIVTLVDQRSYSAESLNDNPNDLISLDYMMRADVESPTESSRFRSAYEARRDYKAIGYQAATGRAG